MSGELRFDGKVVIVTGAGGGLGASYAELLGARGAQVVVNDVGTDDTGRPTAEIVAERIREVGGTAVADTHSIAEPEQAAALVEGAIESFGGVDALVNNAGVVRRMPIWELDLDAFDRIWQVNVRGAVLVTRAAWPSLRERSGRVVNATSAAGVLGNYEATAYGSTKAALIGLTKVLALEGIEWGVRANAIAPRALTAMSPPGTAAGWQTGTIDARLVAPVVAWLCHERCSITGEILSATGGHVARFFTGLTPGYFDPDLTLESVDANMDRIREETGYTVPREPREEQAIVRSVFAAHGTGGDRSM
jgi:NAD(P)-dependent dehydrogenase (short-subunit alcohol dehydrogenase family)